MHRPLVWFTIIFIIGIITGAFWPFPLGLIFVLAGVSLLVAVFGYWRKWWHNKYAVALLIYLVGLLLTQLAIAGGKTDLISKVGQTVTLSGTVIQEPVAKNDNVQYTIKLNTIEKAGLVQPAQGKIILGVKSDRVSYSYGDNIKFRGKLETPQGASNPGEFDYQKFLERQGILLTMRLWDDSGIEKVATNTVNPIVKLALAAKKKFIGVTEKTLPPKESAIVEGIIFGVTSKIDDSTNELFRQTGVVHVLSVSGLHVALVLAVVLGIGNVCRLPQKVNIIVSISILFFYALMTGFGPAVLRSVIMGTVLLIGKLLDKDSDWPTTLSLAALLILIRAPLDIFNIGFQLSFIATWAILHMSPWLNERLYFLPPMIRNAVTVPLAAQIGTLPLIAYYFNFMAPVSLLANVVAVPLTSLILILGFCAAILGLAYLPLAEFINYSTGALLDLFLTLVKGFSMLPGSVFYVSTPPIWAVILAYGLLLAMVNSDKFSGILLRIRRLRQFKGKLLIAGLVMVALLVWSSVLWAGESNLKVTFINVGEGDSILIQTPQGRTMLIDTGPANARFDSGERIILPFLRRIGVSKLDILLLTHPHEDHIGGAKALIEALPVDMVIISPAEQTDNSYGSFLKKVAAKSVDIEVAQANYQIKIDRNIEMSILYPTATIKGTYSDLNNNSVVIKLTYGQQSFLFTGDIEKEAIDRLMADGVSLKATVFKLPHHGSKNSLVPEFYSQINPSYGVITVGPNRFGHPARETVSELTRQKIKVMRTDNDGAVTFSTDGHRLTVEAFKKGVP